MTGAIYRSRRQNFFLILILGGLNTITPVSIDMYLPAFPKIAIDLHTNVGKVALSVSTYFLGFAIGQIVYGPLLDRFGRKRPLYIGLALYIIATILCISSGSINAFLINRFIQALGGSVASVAAIAMVRDFFPVDKSAKVISLLILVLGVSPLLAPTIGGFIITARSWHFVFILLAVVGLAMEFVVFFFLPEGHKPDTSVSLKPKPILKGFRIILSEPRFYIFALAGSFSFAGLFVYVAGSPAIFMDSFHVSAKMYGGIFAVLSIGFIGGSQLNHLLARKYSNEDIFKMVLIIQVIVSMLFLLGELNSHYALLATISFLFILLLCAGLTYPNAAAIALAPSSNNAGTASALLGFLQLGIGGLISTGVGLLHFKGNLSTALSMAVSALVGLTILLIGRNRIAPFTPVKITPLQKDQLICGDL